MMLAIVPLLCSHASCINRPRSATTRRPVAKSKTPAAVERRDLAQAEAEAQTPPRPACPAPGESQQRQAVHKQRRLADTRLREFGLGTLETDPGQVPAEHAVGLLVKRARAGGAITQATCPCPLSGRPDRRKEVHGT